MKTDFSVLAIGTVIMASFALGATSVVLTSSRQPAPLHVVCDSGNEFADEALIRDPYYKYSWKCNAGNVNGPVVIVEVID